MAKKSATKAEKTVNETQKKASTAKNTAKSSGKKPTAKKPRFFASRLAMVLLPAPAGPSMATE